MSMDYEAVEKAYHDRLTGAAALVRKGAAANDAGDLVVAKRKDGQVAVAFLVTFRHHNRSQAVDVVLPLTEGSNRILRDELGDHVLPESLLPKSGQFIAPILEQGQWTIVIKDRTCVVLDGWSTNGSCVVPSSVSFERHPRHFGEPDGGPGGIAVEHANEGRTPVPLREGDSLIGCYASFVFGWV